MLNVLRKSQQILQSMKKYSSYYIKPLRVELKPYKTLTQQVHINESNLIRYEKLCGFRQKLTLPISYPHLLVSRQHHQIFSQTDFPFPLVGLLHVKNIIEQYRPIFRSEVLDLESQVVNLEQITKGYRFELISKVFSENELIWKSSSTFEHRGGKSYPFTHPSETKIQFAELPLNEVREWQLTQERARHYAQISKDFNPVHFSTSNTHPTAHEMYLTARILAEVFDDIPSASHVAASFLKPVYLPSFMRLVIQKDSPGKSVYLTDENRSLRHLTVTVTKQ